MPRRTVGKHPHRTPAPSPLPRERPDNGSGEQPVAPVLPVRHAHGGDAATLPTEERGNVAEA